jgi:CBS domain containing-hemolysin-like protein
LDDPPSITYLTFILAIIIHVLLARLAGLNTALRRTTVERLAEMDIKRARILLSMFTPRYVLGHVIILGQITASAIGCILSLRLTQGLRSAYTPGWSYLDDLLVSGIYVFLAVLLTSIMPPYRREEGSESPLPRVIVACYPIYLLLVLPAIVIQRAETLFVSDDDLSASKEEELRNIVESETEDGTIEAEEREMIEGIFDFGDTTVREVMIPRIDMVCADIDAPTEEILDLLRRTHHSRIPVYEDRVDHIRGLIYVKDLLHAISAGEKWETRKIMRPPHFVPENKAIDDLLTEFKSTRIHMAIVLDEYGGTAGLVTLEDLIEEIVGEIQDEYDEETPLFEWEDDQTLTADARIAIDDLGLILGVDLPQEGYETLGGFIYDQLGHVPNPGESLEYGTLALEIGEVEGQRITKVRIEKREAEDAESADGAEGHA